MSLYLTDEYYNAAQSPRAGKDNGRHWIFYPPDQKLPEKMGTLVDDDISNVEL